MGVAVTAAPPPRSRKIAGRVLALTLVALLALLAIYGTRLVMQRSAAARTVAADAPLSEQCREASEQDLAAATRITLAGQGLRLGGAVVGAAGSPGAVVLRHGASQTICDWLPWARQVSQETGTRVLLFDRRGRGSSPGEANVGREGADTAVAMDWLRANGAQRVGLVGSSMGNAVVFAALPRLSTPPCAVVAISPVLTARDDEGSADGSTLESLIANTWVAWESQAPPIVAGADAIVAAMARQGLRAPHTLRVETEDHSRQLLLRHQEVADFVTDAIASCA